MFLVVGLGNPDKKYEKTRHNVGFMAVDFLVETQNLTSLQRRVPQLKSLIFKNKNFIIAKPLSYMNLSGQVVLALSKYYKIKPEKITIIYDELDLPLGKIRVREKGSSAGHKGIASIIKHLATDKFWRIRLGIRTEKAEKISAEKYVLRKFSKREQKQLQEKIFPETIEKLKGIIRNN